MSSYIISVTAADRVGIVYSVTGALLDQGGNVLELSQTVMRGYFTIILEADFPSPATARAARRGDPGARQAVRPDRSLVTEVKDGRDEPPVAGGERFILTVLGDDSPGIVHNIAGCLARARREHRRPARAGRRRSVLAGHGGFLIRHDLTPAADPVRAGAVRPGAQAGGVRPAREHLRSPPPNPAPSGWRRPSAAKESPLHRTEDVLATLSMIRQHKLDVRTVTMGVDLAPCASPDLTMLCDRIRERLIHYAGRLRAVCRDVESRYGIPIVNRRIAVSPIGRIAAGQRAEGLLAVARTLDDVAAEVEVDLVGGFTALVQKGWTDSDRRLIAALPEVLSTTSRVCSSVNVGTTAAGINMDAIAAARARPQGHGRADQGPRRLRLRQARDLRQRPQRQPVHGGRVPRRRARPIA